MNNVWNAINTFANANVKSRNMYAVRRVALLIWGAYWQYNQIHSLDRICLTKMFSLLAECWMIWLILNPQTQTLSFHVCFSFVGRGHFRFSSNNCNLNEIETGTYYFDQTQRQITDKIWHTFTFSSFLVTNFHVFAQLEFEITKW